MSDLQEAIQEWMSANVRPTSFYQTRITRTPGVVDPSLNQNVAAIYDPNTAGAEEVRRTSLDPAIQQILVNGFSGKKGFVRSQPWAPSNVMKHEQIHNIFDEGDLYRRNEIGTQVDPRTADYLRTNPVFQQGAQRLGWPTVLANEGPAIDLTTPDRNNRLLVDTIAELLSRSGKATQLKQLKEIAR